MDNFKKATFGWEDFFYSASKSDYETKGYNITETPSKLHGMCFTIEKKTNITNMDPLVLNVTMDWDIDLYLHEKGEELWIGLGINQVSWKCTMTPLIPIMTTTSGRPQ
jgi:hypothetical protein